MGIGDKSHLDILMGHYMYAQTQTMHTVTVSGAFNSC